MAAVAVAEAAEALEFQLEPGRRRLRMSGWCDGFYCEVYRQRIGWGDSPPMYVCVHVDIRLPEELNIDTHGPLPHDRLSSQFSVGSPSFHKLVRVWGDASSEPVVRSWLDDDVQAYLSDILTRSRLRVRIHKGSLVGRRIDEAKYKVDADALALIVRQTVELGRLLQASQQDTS